MAEQTNFCGIICEFNPLHFGHRAILERAKTIAPVICVMSGSFVQRGEPAMLDKWSRTRLALESGADLVFELPLPWACAGAERFAFGAVSLLNALGLEGSLFFGSETGETALLEETAAILLSPGFQAKISGELKQSKASFAQTRENVLRRHFGAVYAQTLRQPNNILGIEYCKALQRLNAPIRPLTLLRQGAGHDRPAQSGEFLSASEIRRKILSGEDFSRDLPPQTASLLQERIENGEAPHSLAFLERSLLSRLRRMSADEFAQVPDVGEGLEYKLASAVKQACSAQELYTLVKSKRYSHARIRRIVLSAFLGLTKELPEAPAYLRVLGMNRTGEQLLRQAQPRLPLAVRPSDFRRLGGMPLRLFELEAQADDLYALSAPRILPCGDDYTRPLIKLSSNRH